MLLLRFGRRAPIGGVYNKLKHLPLLAAVSAVATGINIAPSLAVITPDGIKIAPQGLVIQPVLLTIFPVGVNVQPQVRLP